MYRLLGRLLSPLVLFNAIFTIEGKWVEGRIDTKDNWAFLARFCFLSVDGQFEYLIEFDKEQGTPNLLLYYDEPSQWPAVYHSSKTCEEREAVLNRAGQNQIIKLSHWYPDTEYSGCILKKQNKEVPASMSTTTPKPLKTTSRKVWSSSTTKDPNLPPDQPHNTSYYKQFLKTTVPSKTSAPENVTTWFELLPTDDWNVSSTSFPEEEWESIGPEKNETRMQKLEDVEILFDDSVNSSRKIKRSTFELIEKHRRRRLKSDSSQIGYDDGKVDRYVVSCHNSRRFRSARERWWFIAISNCVSDKGLNIKYRFLMTNGADGDFWHEHFSADEFYVLPILLAYLFAYVIVIISVVMCSVELKSRHLLHATYKLFLSSVVVQHLGILMQSLAYVRYATNGVGAVDAKIVGQFFCGMAETTFMLLLVLMGKGYTITRGRLKVGFTVKLTVFMCCYLISYVVLFIYQAKAFDPGEVLYLYESPAGYALIVLRVVAWCVFAQATFFTVRKYPDKNMFYAPFSICGTMWFYAGPLFILTANSYIDKWVRESVVTAVLLFITFNGHVMFLLLTLPVFANKNFPYHVRTTQIGVMEVTGNPTIDGFGHNAYHPSNGNAQTVIIPLTRRTEELIGNIYSQYMASPTFTQQPNTPKLNGVLKSMRSLSPKNKLTQQDSTDTNTSDDIKPTVSTEGRQDIFTVENQMSKINQSVLPDSTTILTDPVSVLPDTAAVLTDQNSLLPLVNMKNIPNNALDGSLGTNGKVSELPLILRSRRTMLEPLKKEDVPVWSLAKGPSVIAMHKKRVDDNEDNHDFSNTTSMMNGKKVPSVRNGLKQNSGEISTILEGHVQSYQNSGSNSTMDLFRVGKKG